MTEEKINQILDDFARSTSGSPYRYELAEKIVHSETLKNALVERCRELLYCSQDVSHCSQDVSHFLDRDSDDDTINRVFDEAKRSIRNIQQSVSGEDLLNHYTTFRGCFIGSCSISLVSNSNMYRDFRTRTRSFDYETDKLVPTNPEVVRSLLESYKKHDLLDSVQGLSICQAMPNKSAMQPNIKDANKEYFEIIQSYLPEMTYLDMVSIEVPKFYDEEERRIKELEGVAVQKEFLDFSKNKIEYLYLENIGSDAFLKDAIKQMPYLRTLSINDTDAQKIERYYNNTSLTSKNPFFTGEFLQNLQDSKIKALELTNLGLTQVPTAICSLNNLEKLDLSNNKIKELPPFLENTSIKELYLHNNQLTRTDNLPLATLNKLDLSYNPIEKLNENFAAFLVVSEMTFGEDKKALISGINLAGNKINIDSLPKETWKELLDVFDEESLARKLSLNPTQGKKFVEDMKKVLQEGNNLSNGSKGISI